MSVAIVQLNVGSYVRVITNIRHPVKKGQYLIPNKDGQLILSRSRKDASFRAQEDADPLGLVTVLILH